MIKKCIMCDRNVTEADLNDEGLCSICMNTSTEVEMRATNKAGVFAICKAGVEVAIIDLFDDNHITNDTLHGLAVDSAHAAMDRTQPERPPCYDN